jgi:hypothetical protein
MFLVHDLNSKLICSLINDNVSLYIPDDLSRKCSILNIHLCFKPGPSARRVSANGMNCRHMNI